MKMKLLVITLLIVLLQVSVTLGKKNEIEGGNSLQAKDCIDKDCSNRSLPDKSLVIENEEAILLPTDKEDEFGLSMTETPPVDKKRWWQLWQSSDSKRENLEREMNREKR